MLNQQIRFCKSFDGARIAYAVTGNGPLLVKAPHWLTHLEYEFQSPLWKPWIEELLKHYTLLRMDERPAGSPTGTLPTSRPRHGCAICVRNPQRVSHLAILGGYARGWLKRGLPPEQIAALEAQLKLVEVGWGRDDPAYRNIFSTQFAPGATLEQINSMSELQRKSASPENAVRIIRAFFNIDVEKLAPRVGCPTLVLHGRGDRRAPFEEGRILASLIPGARLVPLDTENHILLAHEPAYRHFFYELEAFIPRAPKRKGAEFSGLTAREAEILERIAQGLDNAQIAAHLGMSEKTVRNHITRIFDKLEVENRDQAIVRAREAGLGLRGALA